MTVNTAWMFHIRVRGVLDPCWAAWFDGLQVVPCPESGETLLVGPLVDQAALSRVLNKLFNLGVTLLRLETCEAQNTPLKSPPDTPNGA